MTTTPSLRTRTRLFAGVAVLAVGGLLAAGCADDEDTASSDDTEQTTTTTSADDMSGEQMAGDDMAGDDMAGDDMAGDDTAMEPSGPGCAAVPTAGEGSFGGMADDPAATAASNNPALSTLVSAVGAAGLVDTLNGPGPFTIFAPVNDAFAAIPADQLQSVLADQDLLTSILTYHVVAGERLSSADLVEQGSATTVRGEELTFTGSDGTVTVDGTAEVVCMDVPTANATVHLIDAVLMPPA